MLSKWVVTIHRQSQVSLLVFCFLHFILLNFHLHFHCPYSLILYSFKVKEQSDSPSPPSRIGCTTLADREFVLRILYPPNTMSSIYQPWNIYLAYTNFCPFYDIEQATYLFCSLTCFILSLTRLLHYFPEPTLAKFTKDLLIASQWIHKLFGDLCCPYWIFPSLDFHVSKLSRPLCPSSGSFLVSSLSLLPLFSQSWWSPEFWFITPSSLTSMLFNQSIPKASTVLLILKLHFQPTLLYLQLPISVLPEQPLSTWISGCRISSSSQSGPFS